MLGAGAHWADSTWASIICHAANNLAAVGLAALAWGAPDTLLSLPLGLSVAAACAWRVRREAGQAGSDPRAARPGAAER